VCVMVDAMYGRAVALGTPVWGWWALRGQGRQATQGLGAGTSTRKEWAGRREKPLKKEQQLRRECRWQVVGCRLQARSAMHLLVKPQRKVSGTGKNAWGCVCQHAHLGVLTYECQRWAPLGRMPFCTRAAAGRGKGGRE
jgi:hypothetical protein